MPREHLTRYLRVAGFVCTNQTELAEAIKKQKDAEANEQEALADA